MALPEQHHVDFTVKIELSVFVNDSAYATEPHLEAESRKVWYRSAFIPYMFVGRMRAFMGHIPKYTKKPQLLRDYFPIYHGYEPLVFIDEAFKFNFFKNRVFRSSPPREDVEYIKWLDRIGRRKTHYWKDLGILRSSPSI
ncbi:unnamed protein product [Lathyrus oleraceus]